MPKLMSREVRQARAEERRMRRQLGEGTVGGDLSAVWRALAPWAILVTTLGLAPAASYGAEQLDMREFLAVCLTLAGAVALSVSVNLTKGRMTLGRAHELVNVAGTFGLLVFNVGWGFDRYVFAGGLIFGATSAYVWNRRHTSTAMRELERQAGRGHARGNVPAAWKAFATEYLPQVADSDMTVMRNDDDVFVAGLELGPAGVPDDFAEDLIKRVTRFAGGIAGGTTLAIGEQLDRIGITVVRRDPLKTPFGWQGPRGMGESIVEPIEGLGMYRDRVDLSLLLPHVPGKTLTDEDKQNSHLLMVGTSRAGKGEAGELIDVNAALRSDAAVVVCDAVKADQQLGVLAEADLDNVYVLDNASAIRSFLWRLVNTTIPQRSAFLGDPNRNLLGKRLKEWAPGCGLTWVLVHAYEAAALYGNKNLTLITERAASVGIKLIIEAQKGIHDRVDTNARSNANDLLLFGTFDRDDTTLVVEPELLDMGVAPWVWKNKRPGMVYPLLSYLPLHRQVIPARFARKSDDDLLAALAEYGHLAGGVDPLTARSWGDPYEAYVARRQAARERAPRQHSFAPRPAAAPSAARPATVAGAVLLDERPPAGLDDGPVGELLAAELPPAAARRAAPADPMPDTGFDLDDPEDEDPPGEDDERDELTRVAEHVVGDLATELEGDPEAGEVLNTAVDALEQWDDSDGIDLGPAAERFDDIEFPDDPDEAHFRVIVDRSEAIDILLDELRQIGEGERFKPAALYEGLARRARKSDSWVRKCMPLLVGWGCIAETEKYGEYEIIHTRRSDLDDYATSPDTEL
ncbi:hypothetical protein [Nonomuraea rubra]|uniref:hypothetical protein n=1 Tax=Nonomuraea rubra TaxID=46180 RepID=UPI0034111619